MWYRGFSNLFNNVYDMTEKQKFVSKAVIPRNHKEIVVSSLLQLRKYIICTLSLILCDCITMIEMF